MELFGIADVWPGVVAHRGNSGRVEAADLRQNSCGKDTAHFDGAGAAFFERGIVEVSVRVGVQDFVGKL